MESEAAQRTILLPTPGLSSFVNAASGISDNSGRALFSMNDRCDAVIGGGIYNIASTQTVTRLGSCSQDNNPATISYNGAAGAQRFVTSGGNGYLVKMSDNSVSQVLTGTATMGGMIDGYFLAFNLTATTFRISALNDGTTWDPTQFASNSITADPWKAMKVDGNRKIWLIGEQRGQIWYDSGAFPFPFVPYPGAVFNYGTPASFSVQVVGSSMMWLTRTENGQAQVVKTQGFQPVRVSNHAVENAISGYARTASITDAEAFSYEDNGHLFYILTFPSVPATWGYDATTNKWHERGKWNTASNSFDAWEPRVHCQAFGQHLVGVRDSGTIATMDVNTGSELDGTAIRRLRIPPPLRVTNRRGRMSISRFEAQFEPGTSTLLTGQGSAPQVMLRTSQTFGKRWDTQRLAPAGVMGDFHQKVYWSRMGSSRDTWTPEITVSDPVPWRLVDGYVDGYGFIGSQAA